MNHFIELEQKRMIQRDNTAGLISMTNKGKKFIEQYKQLLLLIESVGL